GTVISSIREVGVRALAFPFAAVIGSIVIGTAASMFFGFTMREGVAISAGFGWYTYAPTVIASAGSEYMVASAVSFMHNVIREVSGIVLIPILAKKIGYLEMTGIPGVAAMDVCMPIVERSCRHDTVVYSFAVGLLMCIVTSLLVPLAMGV
ncbi:MAG: lysine exporter LysO family protein, partial [Firmicutes bacterium]|nr:lysine exporter LysO family protein [Bacillota bacterium]